MNLPTKITVFRIILAPIFFIIFFIPEWTGCFAVGSVGILIPMLIVMELSDVLDGYIARKHNLVTDLGKILDPFSDVISRVTFFICFTFTGIMPLWTLLIIIYRELSITFLRMMMMGRGTAMAASIWGKAKAVTYTAASALGLIQISIYRLGLEFPGLMVFETVTLVFFILAAAASALSFMTYAVNVRRVFKSNETA
ncbi:MAG: CDP-diacylglycerol--glycerol-3-phosphate 3-phosphatidyltransferase [Spirochaetales bacterium]|uniref:CDP-diacylglycerol--glycerol-3-phosphate 3-phosphatidyltransferase n=1 Tax=Candidatus Thalassospirochaeta sargassi TaxID=3119039 RepID=A0AAJ1IF01_9SPIO|nr:CDP-diacylglycerol--glycerol-3-phosphate 3-phosphatidyltransferase [Spirochaetales bacterium]